MPIYEYRCTKCGFQKEFLQRVSDAPLKKCPECGKSALTKLVTAAGFQLKGTGWYATDFKGGGSTASTATSTSEKTDAKQDKAAEKPAAEKPADSKSKKSPKAAAAADTSAN